MSAATKIPAIGGATVQDPGIAVLLLNGDAATWRISQNLTDRWGEINLYKGGYKPLLPLINDINLLARLRAQMSGEDTFIVRKDGSYGILFELEFYTAESDPSWPASSKRAPKPYEDVVSSLRQRVQQIAERFPEVAFAIPSKEQIYDERAGVWAFFADGELAQDRIELLGDALRLL